MGEKLRSLPSLIYTDGNAFSLWQDGELVGSILTLVGDVEKSGEKLGAPPGLQGLFRSFLRWEPIPPRSAKELAHVTARLCRLLRDEVVEQLALGSQALTALATDLRKLLFPDATDERFADGYAQAVTFGLLMARALGISLRSGLQEAAAHLHDTSTLIGQALRRLLTYDAENQKSLRTSLRTLTRVLDAVSWEAISSRARRARESRNVAVHGPRFGLHAGLASSAVTLADPATGTGTFLLGTLRRIARTVRDDEGEGTVGPAVHEALQRLIAFELQLGPFAVAQLRVLAEVMDLTGTYPKTPVRMYVTDTLGDPNDHEGWVPAMYGEIARFRKEASRIKREQPITVVLGNPPYKEKAKGLGGWVEARTRPAGPPRVPHDQACGSTRYPGSRC